MNLWKPPRRVSGPAFVGIGFGILFFFFIIGLAIGEFYPMLTGAIFFVLILLVVLIRWLIERRGASGDDGEPVPYSSRSRVSTSDDIRAGMARAKAQKEAAAAQPAPEAPKEPAPSASPSLPLLELVEKLRKENEQLRQRITEQKETAAAQASPKAQTDPAPAASPSLPLLELVEKLRKENEQLRRRVTELEQAQPQRSPRDQEIEERSLLRMADALEEYKAVISAQRERIEHLEKALTDRNMERNAGQQAESEPAAAEHPAVREPEPRREPPAWVISSIMQKQAKALRPTVPPESIDPDGPLYGKTVVFTGSFSRPLLELMQGAVNCGAKLWERVTMKTDILVCGVQDPEIVGEDGLSGKQETALRYNAEGKAKIEMIDEAQFLGLLSK